MELEATRATCYLLASAARRIASAAHHDICVAVCRPPQLLGGEPQQLACGVLGGPRAKRPCQVRESSATRDPGARRKMARKKGTRGCGGWMTPRPITSVDRRGEGSEAAGSRGVCLRGEVAEEEEERGARRGREGSAKRKRGEREEKRGQANRSENRVAPEIGGKDRRPRRINTIQYHHFQTSFSHAGGRGSAACCLLPV